MGISPKTEASTAFRRPKTWSEDKPEGFLNRAKRSTKPTASAASETVSNAAGSAGEAMSDTASSIVDGVKSAASSVSDVVSSAGSKTSNASGRDCLRGRATARVAQDTKDQAKAETQNSKTQA